MENAVGYKYNLLDDGESSYKIKWEKTHKIGNLADLQRVWTGVRFISTSGKSTICKQFANDFKKAIKKELGTEYNIIVDVGHFYISGFVELNGKYMYYSIEDLRDNGDEFNNVLYRTAENEKDYTGGRNQFCELRFLAENIKRELEK